VSLVVGIYWFISHSEARIAREIAILMALGALPGQVLWMVLRQGLTLIVIGVGSGLAGTFSLTWFLSNQLFGITPTDPLTFAAVSLSLARIVPLVCYVPACWATQIDPMVTQRYE
jgi:putative ABC transport system permease protein